MNVDFEKMGGLVPVVVQDDRTGQVLMLAYMNREAMERTLAEGQVTFFSRSRQRLWTKGETSGNSLRLRSLTTDCDGDTLLARVLCEGPVCHTGSATCFDESSTGSTLDELESVLRSRQAHPETASYTSQLLQAGPRRIAKKLGEEAVETALEAESGSDERLLEEAADLVYHLLVLLRSRDLRWADVERELARRRRA